MLPLLRRLLLSCALAAAFPAAAAAQAPAAELRVASAQEAFLSAPNGARVALLSRGARLRAGAARQGWREVTLEGWVPAARVGPGGSVRNPLKVRGATPLLAAPGGARIGEASDGMVAAEAERRDGWVRLRRTGWVWGRSLEPAPAASAAPAPAASNPPRPSTPAPAPARATRTDSAPPASAATPASPSTPASATAPPSASAPTPASASPPARGEPGTAVLYDAPGGSGRVAVVTEGTPVRVLERRGGWTRVRVEGWTRAPVPADAPPAGGLTLRELREDPEAHAGREVEWTLRFVSLQVAEPVRTDLVTGETFLLARDPGGEPGYVYVPVPAQLREAVSRLTPLQEFRMVGRVRTGRSPLMGHPIVELVRLR